MPAPVQIEDAADGGVLYWLLRLYAFGAAATVTAAAHGLAGVYLYLAATSPPLPDMRAYAREAPGVTTLRALDGTPIAELATERREFVPYARIPRRLVDAFVAAEDRRFFEHGGIDFKGVLRALVANWRAGQVLQGGSTITQQVAKTWLLSPERTLARKLREAILARRLEARYDKREILAIYLNHIFLGAGAYGVQAAARRYFDKDVAELDLGEMATIAGLAQAPSRTSPLSDPARARARRDEVLHRMVDAGSMAEAEATAWSARPLVVRPRADLFRERAPYFAEHVRRTLGRTYGDEALFRSGLRVETTVRLDVDPAAQENVDFSARKLDKRQGWRGPEARLRDPAARAELVRRATARYGGGPLDEDRLYLGLVERVDGTGARVRVGARSVALPLDGLRWAAPFSANDPTNDRVIERATAALAAGDVIWVRAARHARRARFRDWSYDPEGEPLWSPAAERPEGRADAVVLEQTPRVQGLLYTLDLQTGYAHALVGGTDYDRSEFDRVTQACRQPGSSYKPIYYSLALDRGYGYGTLLGDVPKAEVDPITGEVWVPQNLGGTVDYQVTLEYALVWSKNIPSVELFTLVGAHEVEAWARRLGFTTPIIADKALALGASCVRPDELSRAFALLARNGRWLDPVYVRRVVARDGRILEDHGVPADPFQAAAPRLDRFHAVAGAAPRQVVPARTAYLTSQLLRRAISHGHAGSLRATKIPAAGKTGTSSATMDTWFVGYTSRWLTTAWLGDDTRERQLGYKDAAFMLTVPMWTRFMHEVVADQPLAEIPWERPAGVRANDAGGPLRGQAPPPLPPRGGIPAGPRPVAGPAKALDAPPAPRPRPAGR